MEYYSRNLKLIFYALVSQYMIVIINLLGIVSVIKNHKNELLWMGIHILSIFSLIAYIYFHAVLLDNQIKVSYATMQLNIMLGVIVVLLVINIVLFIKRKNEI